MNNQNLNKWGIKDNFTFNFSKFKLFKKKLNEYLENKYNTRLNELFGDKEMRESIFKYILWFDWNSDIFQSWRKQNINDFEISNELNNIISELKEQTKTILYSK
jgi:hypothetical protein